MGQRVPWAGPPPLPGVSDVTNEPTDETPVPEDPPIEADLRAATDAVPPPVSTGVAGATGPPVDTPAERRDWLALAGKVGSGIVAMFLFVLAIQLMKSGAKSLAPTIQDSPLFSNGASTLGAGWLGAYIVLSGSPIAAVALGLFAGGAITKLQTFTMLSGSRLGASFIVLLVGFLYSVRNKGANREEAVGMGILALSMTAIVYLPGMAIGYWLLRSGFLDGVHWHASGDVLSIIDYVWGPTQDFITGHLPGWLLLPVGLGIILISFRFLDRVLPQMTSDRASGKRAQRLKRPWPMFLLGCLVATLTLSVSVALTVLVPLASRGYVNREESIPYIMGANITTLADTLVAAMLLGNPVAVQIVLAEAIGVSFVSIIYLAFFYGFIKREIIALDNWVVATNRRLWVFVAGIFVLPVFFLTSGLWLGLFTR
jgi:solute carrier family 34 (sodium-dependent phosphate cotransporter)